MYQVVYADPPWSYRNQRTGGSHRSGAAQHYPTLTVDEVAALPVRRLVARSATLWLWATVPLLPEILPVMGAWGFTYKTALIWHKTGRKGIGYWFRGEAECLLFGVRGRVPAFRSPRSNVIAAPVEGHSRKPDVFRALIESVTPHQSRLELFARRPATAGWTCTGFESDGHDVRGWEAPESPLPYHGLCARGASPLCVAQPDAPPAVLRPSTAGSPGAPAGLGRAVGGR
jgi:N6-adenosine-specific RNA methylase IME4